MSGIYSINAQSLNDTILIRAVDIVDYKKQKEFYNYQTIDSVAKTYFNNRNISDLLSSQTSVFIKSYGPGSLATSSIRGLSAAHTQLLWEGINISSPTLGQNDFSLVNTQPFKDIKILLGNAAVTNSSGALGGAINLSSNPKFNTRPKIINDLTLGSFGVLGNNFSIATSNGKIENQLSITYFQTNNNFQYYDPILEQTVKQQHSDYKQINISNDVFYKFKNNDVISLKLWAANNQRNLPSTMITPDFKESQQDGFARAMLSYDKTKGKWLLNAKNYFAYEKLYYESIVGAIYSDNYFYTNKTQVNAIRKGNNNVFKTQLNQELYKAKTDGYVKEIQQLRTSALIDFSQSFKTGTSINGQVRQDIVDNKFIPTIWTAAIKQSLLKYFEIIYSSGQNTRVPTLNDLYWFPGGNLNLKQERSFNNEVVLKFNYRSNKITETLSATAFSNKVDNWIIWLPGIYNYWQPQNVKTVWARGFEVNQNLTLSFNKAKIQWSVIYNYNLATNEKVLQSNDNSLHRQLIYTPIYNVKSNLLFAYKQFGAYCNFQFYSWRAISTDNYDYLPYYKLFEMGSSYTFNYRTHKFTLKALVKNILNERYQVLAYRAMPGRNYLISLCYEF